MTTHHDSEQAVRTMHIGELAEETGLSLRTIRHDDDDVGLLPANARTDGGFRVYTEGDLTRLLVIRSMKPLGFTLEQMAELHEIMSRLARSNPNPGDQAMLNRYLSEAQAKRDKLARNLDQADELILSLRTR